METKIGCLQQQHIDIGLKEQLRDNPPRFTGFSEGDSFQNQVQLLSDHFFDLPLLQGTAENIYRHYDFNWHSQSYNGEHLNRLEKN